MTSKSEERTYTQAELDAAIRATIRRAADHFDARVKECAAIRHGEKPVPHTVGHAIYFDQEVNRFEESFSIKARDFILSLATPHQSALESELAKARLEARRKALEVIEQYTRIRYSRDQGEPNPTPAFPVEVVISLEDWALIKRLLDAPDYVASRSMEESK
jgi:hypothetical protein